MRLALFALLILLVIGAWFAFQDGGPRGSEPSVTIQEAAVETRSDDTDLLQGSDEPDESETRAVVDTPSDAPLARELAPDPGEETQAPIRATLRILEEGSEQPLAGFEVRVEATESTEFEHRTTTDASGRLLLELPFVRGKLYLDHIADRTHERFQEPWIFVQDSFLVDVAAGVDFEQIFYARPPVARVAVRVHMGSGRPAVGARLHFGRGRKLESGGFQWAEFQFGGTDSKGAHVFYLHDAEVFENDAVIMLHETFKGEVCAPLTIGPPLTDGPHELRLYPGGEIDIVVVDPEGKPVPGLEVWPRNLDKRNIRGKRAILTDEAGHAVFTELAGGEYSAMVRDAAASIVLAQQEIVLEPSEIKRLEMTVAAGARPAVQVVAGHVVDANGAPVPEKHLAVSLDGRKPVRIRADENGLFQHMSAVPVESVTVYGAAGLFDSVVEPEIVTVPAGTTDLEFIVGEAVPHVAALFEVLSAETGATLTDEDEVALSVYREPAPGRRVLATLAYGLSEGSSEIQFVPVGDVRWRVTAPGYHEQRGKIDLGKALGAEPLLIRVALERGFQREVFVLDRSTGEPLEGVVAIADDLEFGRSDFAGRILLERATWPEWIEFRLSGYEPNRWNPESHWSHHSQRFWMEPPE
jgi:hypothetical protein